MDISRISTGRDPPDDLHAVIEIPVGGVPVKYEFDKISGAMFVDRFLHTAMFYPGNYGFIPAKHALDGKDGKARLPLERVPALAEAPGD